MKTLLLKPFEKYSEKNLLIVGISFTVLGSFLGFCFNARFDGVLDLHFAKNVPLQRPFFDNLLNIFSLTILLFPLAKHLNKKTRLIDILNTVMIARIPFYLMSLMNIDGFMVKTGEKFLTIIDPNNMGLEKIDPQRIVQMVIDNLFSLSIIIILSITFLVWYIALLYHGFKTASHAKGSKPIVLFSIALLLAEILSKTLIYTLN